ncbi:MAG: hypothetical protein F6K19_37425 [Cyanothece sp. SIO1E1]|nr:hypothetical protein [Cyanothece sp. SIO1E1]
MQKLFTASLVATLVTATTPFFVGASALAQFNSQPEPEAIMQVPSNGQISIRLVNQTGNAITYQAVGDTELRTLSVGEAVLLRGLNVPATLAYYYRDIVRDTQAGKGLVQANLAANSSGALEVVLKATSNLASDSSTVQVDREGNIFLL